MRLLAQGQWIKCAVSSLSLVRVKAAMRVWCYAIGTMRRTQAKAVRRRGPSCASSNAVSRHREQSACDGLYCALQPGPALQPPPTMRRGARRRSWCTSARHHASSDGTGGAAALFGMLSSLDHAHRGESGKGTRNRRESRASPSALGGRACTSCSSSCTLQHAGCTGRAPPRRAGSRGERGTGTPNAPRSRTSSTRTDDPGRHHQVRTGFEI
mmetsp:Transcript_141/g.504  ORF Transcript_141/g.504 Transcript_141/m.504 type:complete len:212 (-) Transcript_141:7-642(-)